MSAHRAPVRGGSAARGPRRRSRRASHRGQAERSRGALILGGLVVVAGLTGITAAAFAAPGSPLVDGTGAGRLPAAASSATPDASSGPDRSTTPTTATGALQDPVAPSSAVAAVRVPASVSIPAIDVVSDLESLGLDASTGWVEAPSRWGRAGWYAAGVVPGAIGPAVIAGHLDSDSGPAVFARLDELVVGDTVSIAFTDGTTSSFAVDRVETVDKRAFPSDEVYGPTPDAQLRIITCDGLFDGDYGHYLDNRVVYATALTG